MRGLGAERLRENDKVVDAIEPLGYRHRRLARRQHRLRKVAAQHLRQRLRDVSPEQNQVSALAPARATTHGREHERACGDSAVRDLSQG